MSLLSDLLSGIRHEQQAKDAPPGLRNIVGRSNRRWVMKRQMFFLFSIIIVVIISGLFVVHIVKIYFPEILRIQSAQSEETTRTSTSALSKKSGTVSFQIADKKAETLSPVIERHDSAEHAQGPASSVPVQDKDKPAIQAAGTEGESQPSVIERQESAEHTQGPASSVPVQDEDKPAARKSELVSEFHAEFRSKFENTKSDSSKKDTYLHLASSYELKKDYINALSNYKIALTIDPKDYRIMNKIGSLHIELRLFKEALIYLQEAIDIKNDYVPALINAGIAYAGLADLSKAEIYLSFAVALEPYNKFAVFNIALLYEKMGDYGKAQEYYSMLMKMGDVKGDAGIVRTKKRFK